MPVWDNPLTKAVGDPRRGGRFAVFRRGVRAATGVEQVEDANGDNDGEHRRNDGHNQSQPIVRPCGRTP